MKIPSYKQIRNWILNLPPIRWTLNWMKKNSLPGFFGVSIYDVLIFIRNEIKGQRLNQRANSIAYSFFISLFPALLSVITLFPILEKHLLKYLPEGQDFGSLLFTFRNEFKDFIPLGIFDTIEDIATNPRFGLFSLGFLLAIFFASNGVLSMMTSFDKAHISTFKQRSAIKKRTIAIGLTFLIAFLVFTSILLVVLGQFIFHPIIAKLNLTAFEGHLLNGLRWVIVVASFYLVITSIYRYAAATYKKFSFFSPGTTLATILSLTSSLVFSYFVDNFDAYNKLYGSIGTIIVTMLWIQINAFVLLIGFELNASIAVNRDLKKAAKVVKN